jgi:hypothetical protein
MNSARKPLSLLVATLIPLGASRRSGRTWGSGHRSALGELRAEIRLVRAAGEEFDATCFKRVGNNAGNDDIPGSDARMRVSGDRLIVTTRDR